MSIVGNYGCDILLEYFIPFISSFDHSIHCLQVETFWIFPHHASSKQDLFFTMQSSDDLGKKRAFFKKVKARLPFC